MAALNIIANVIADPYPVKIPLNFATGDGYAFGLLVSVTNTDGTPVPGLDESQFQVDVCLQQSASLPGFRFQAKPAKILFTGLVQDQNPDGTPAFDIGFDEDGNPQQIPRMKRVPGPARNFGLPGNYLLLVYIPSDGSRGRAVIQVVVTFLADQGQTHAVLDIAP